MRKVEFVVDPTVVPAPPAPQSVRQEISALVIEYQPVELAWTVDYVVDHAVVYGRLKSGHTVCVRDVLLESPKEIEEARTLTAYRHRSQNLLVAS